MEQGCQIGSEKLDSMVDLQDHFHSQVIPFSDCEILENIFVRQTLVTEDSPRSILKGILGIR